MGWEQHQKHVWIIGAATALAVAYGLCAAHVPWLIDHPWESCHIGKNELPCVLSFHLFEIPIVVEELFFAWYSMKRFRRDTATRWLYLATLSNAIKTGFFVFECILLQQSLRIDAPTWELWVLVSVVFVLLTGLFLNTLWGLPILKTLWDEAQAAAAQKNRRMQRAPGADGYYHPGSEREVQDLIIEARRLGVPVRVRGSAHSTNEAIYPDGYAGKGAPPPDQCVLLLDRLRHVDVIPQKNGRALVEAEAGVNIGKDPYDPTGTSTWANSLNAKLQRKGYALPDLGGISHQTVAGFMSTGSSGGSIQHDLLGAVKRIRFVDGTGKVHDVRADDPDPKKKELFFAVGVSMGLLGVITKVWFEAVPTYNIKGREVRDETSKVEIDFFGDGNGHRDFATYLKETEYARLMWWPQHDFDKMVVWEAERIAAKPNFVPKPYQELGDDPRSTSLQGSLLMTVMGNLDDIDEVSEKLGAWYRHLEEEFDDTEDPNQCARRRPRGGKLEVEDLLQDLQPRLEAALMRAEERGASIPEEDRNKLYELRDPALDEEESGMPKWLAAAVARLIKALIVGAVHIPGAQFIASQFKKHVLASLIDEILSLFVTTGSVEFQDSWLCGLPMDNQMDDQLWPTDFTELWIPLSKAEEVMRAMRDHYHADGDRELALERTGTFACELYATNASKFWMSPAYGEDVLRVDVFWFHLNAGRPEADFFPQFWKLLKPFGFRPHWGKILPPASEEWREHYREHFDKLEEFLTLRDVLDPDQVFLSTYWRAHLGIRKLQARSE